MKLARKLPSVHCKSSSCHESPRSVWSRQLLHSVRSLAYPEAFAVLCCERSSERLSWLWSRDHLYEPCKRDACPLEAAWSRRSSRRTSLCVFNWRVPDTRWLYCTLYYEVLHAASMSWSSSTMAFRRSSKVSSRCSQRLFHTVYLLQPSWFHWEPRCPCYILRVLLRSVLCVSGVCL